MTLVRPRTSGTRQEVSNKSAILVEQAMRAALATVRTKVGVLAFSDALRGYFLPTISYHFSAPSEGKIFHSYRQNSKSRKTVVASPCVSEG